MRVFLKVFAFFVLLFSIFMIYDRYEMKQVKHVEVLNQIDPVPETIKLIKDEKYSEAKEYLQFFMQFDYVKSNPKATQLYIEIIEKQASYEYQGKKVVEGVVYGKSDETIGQVSAGISDFFLFGDLRDLAIEGYHHFTDKEVDKVLVALSTIGVVATTATVLSAGSSAPVKGGVSTLKFIKKSGKMPKWLELFIIKSAKEVKKTRDIKPVKKLFENIYFTTKEAGFNTTMKLLNKAPNKKAFYNSLGFAKTYGKDSGALLKILGNDAPIYHRLLKDKTSKKTFLKASTYGDSGIKRLAKMGEKRFLKSLKIPIKVSRLAKVFNKNAVHMLYKIPDSIFFILGLIALAILV